MKCGAICAGLWRASRTKRALHCGAKSDESVCATGRHPRRAICVRYYGRTEGVVETVLEANPGLSELGVILPHGTAIELPETDSAARTETVNLWD